MPQTRYMELDSNYRNRVEFKNQAQFEVGLSQSGMRTNINAFDPVTNAYPEIVFSPDDFYQNGTPAITYTVPSHNGIKACSSSPIFVGECSGDSCVLVSSYYIGAVLNDTASHKLYRIVAWDVVDITNKLVKITVDSPIDLSTGTIFNIFNPTQFPYIFIPFSKSIDNYYNKYVMWNQNRGVSVPIISYDGTTHVAKLGGDITHFSTGDVYVVRRENPTGLGTLGITKYINPSAPVPITNWFEIQQHVDNSYINGFVRLYKTGEHPITPTGDENPNANIIAKIIGIRTRSSDSSGNVPINTIIVEFANTTSSAIQTDVNTTPTDYSYEIMPFSIDNYSPFVFNGTITSQNQPVAHEITLNSLVLPNVPLKNGGRIAYYPYVYVELENLSATTKSNNNIIFSNNPHTYKALFKVPITDLNHPAISPFVKLTGNGMTQTITFKQNDNMRVSIKLPSGDLFETVKADTSFGQAPDPFIQVSFCFGIERV